MIHFSRRDGKRGETLTDEQVRVKYPKVWAEIEAARREQTASPKPPSATASSGPRGATP